MRAPVAPEALLDAMATDLDGSFAAFVRAHERLVYGICLRALRDASEAEDAAQEAFLRSYRALRDYSPDRIRELHSRAWLARIALNTARNRRRDAPTVTVPLEEAADRADAPNRGPASVVEQRESDRRWSALLDSLPAAQRRAVELRHVHGLSYAEIAEALERPVGTVKVHVHRGVRLLREAHEAALRRERETVRDSRPALPGNPTLRLVPEAYR
jgi:RNA polymerase sigma-70 factor (ECF subfamily)